MKRVAVFAQGTVGRVMSVPAIRARNFARALADRCDVVLVSSGKPDQGFAQVKVVAVGDADPDELARLLRDFDVVVAHRLPAATMRELARAGTRVVYDLFVPYLSEYLVAFEANDGRRSERLLAEWAILGQRFALQTGDAFVCVTERQRDLWLGMLVALGRIDLELYRHDQSLRDLIDVVPVGLPDEAPVHERPALRGVVPGIGEHDRVLLWAGGLWDWLDPLTPIRATARLARRRDDVKLIFLGSHYPGLGQPPMASRAVDLARDLGVLDRSVFFNRGWVPYEERGNFLLEADLGVSAHFDTLETRYAFRTRLIDYLWAGLPTVTTGGDVLGELVGTRGLGRVVGFEDVEGWAAAIEQLLDDPAAYARAVANVERIRGEFAWSKVVEPLIRLVSSPQTARPSRRGSALAELKLRAEVSFAHGRVARTRGRLLGRASVVRGLRRLG